MRALLILLALLLVALPAFGQEDRTAADLDDLLRMVEEGRTRDEAAQRRREAAFRADRDEQKKLLDAARRQLRDAERRSQELEKT